MTPIRIAAVAVALASATLAAPAAAQQLSDRGPRVAANLILGAAGELIDHADFPSGTLADRRTELDAEASVGFDARFEAPVLDFLAIGGFFQFLSVELEDITVPFVTIDFEREETFSFDAYVRARWVFEVLARELFVEPYVMVPFGLTIAVLPDDDGTGDDVWPGWNVAALAGVQVIHGSGFGGSFEIGWRHLEIYQGTDTPVSNTDLSRALNELAIHVGLVYVLGAR